MPEAEKGCLSGPDGSSPLRSILPTQDVLSMDCRAVFAALRLKAQPDPIARNGCPLPYGFFLVSSERASLYFGASRAVEVRR